MTVKFYLLTIALLVFPLNPLLLEKAEAQGNEVLSVIEFMVKNAGWKVEFQKKLFQDITKRDSFPN